MSLRRFVAGPVSFGLTIGLAVVALMLEGFSLDPFPVLALVAWGAAIAVTAVTLKLGWPLLHVSAAGLLMAASLFLVDTSMWALPLAAAVGTMAMGRFASVGFASRWVSQAIGLTGLAGVAFVVWRFAAGSAGIGGDEATLLEASTAAGALAVIGVLGIWHPNGEEE